MLPLSSLLVILIASAGPQCSFILLPGLPKDLQEHNSFTLQNTIQAA